MCYLVMFLEKCDDEVKCYYLFDDGAQTQMMIGCISVLKHFDGVLAKVKSNLMYDGMELTNPLS